MSRIGVEINGASTAGNLVQGNLIGTDVSSTLPLGNAIGVLIDGAPNNTIGGSSAGAANVFGFNNTAGVQITGCRYDRNRRSRQLLRHQCQRRNLGNAVGLIDESAGNTIGGTSAGAANVFGFNSTAGLQINGPNDW